MEALLTPFVPFVYDAGDVRRSNEAVRPAAGHAPAAVERWSDFTQVRGVTVEEGGVTGETWGGRRCDLCGSLSLFVPGLWLSPHVGRQWQAAQRGGDAGGSRTKAKAWERV